MGAACWYLDSPHIRKRTLLHPTALRILLYPSSVPYYCTTPQFTFQHFPTPFIIWSEFVATSSSALHLPPRCRTVIVGALLYLTTLPHFKLYAALPQFATWCPTLDTMVQHLGPGVIQHGAAPWTWCNTPCCSPTLQTLHQKLPLRHLLHQKCPSRGFEDFFSAFSGSYKILPKVRRKN